MPFPAPFATFAAEIFKTSVKMKQNEIINLLRALGIDNPQQPNMLYLFYQTEEGYIRNLSISVRSAHLPNGRKMRPADLMALMDQYPEARDAKVVATEIPQRGITQWVDACDVREMLHTSKSSLQRWVRRGLLHPARVGKSKKLYFDRAEIDQLLRSNIIREDGRLDTTALPTTASDGVK